MHFGVIRSVSGHCRRMEVLHRFMEEMEKNLISLYKINRVPFSYYFYFLFEYHFLVHNLHKMLKEPVNKGKI